MSKSQAWSQPSDPAPAEDLNLNPDTKFGVQGLRGFLWAHPKLKPSTKISSAGAGCPESSVPSPLPQLSHPSMQWLQIHSCVHRNLCFSGALQGRVFLTQRCALGQFILLASGFTLPWLLGFQRTRDRFQILLLQPHIQELLLLLFPRKQGLTLVSFM